MAGIADPSLLPEWALPALGDRQLKMVRNSPGAYPQGLVLGTIRQGITQTIGEEQGDAASIAMHRLAEN